MLYQRSMQSMEETLLFIDEWDSTFISMPDQSDLGSELHIFYSGDSLRLISTYWHWENRRREINFYFHNNELVSAIQKRFVYNRPIYWDAVEHEDDTIYDPEKTKVFISKVYFQGLTPRYWTNEEREIHALDRENLPAEVLNLISYLEIVKNRLPQNFLMLWRS